MQVCPRGRRPWPGAHFNCFDVKKRSTWVHGHWVFIAARNLRANFGSLARQRGRGLIRAVVASSTLLYMCNLINGCLTAARAFWELRGSISSLIIIWLPEASTDSEFELITDQRNELAI